MQKYSFLMSIYLKTTLDELKVSIESMINQTAAPDEIIIVCDGRVPSDLENFLNRCKTENPGLFLILGYEENMGLAYALNYGIQRSRNELIARMDSDDVSLPTRCEKQLCEFEKDAELCLVGTATLDFNDDISNAKQSVSPYPESFDSIKKMIRRNDPFAHPTVMYKKSAIIDCGCYDPQLRRRQDYDLFSKMINRGYKAKNIVEPLLYYKVDDNNFARIKSSESCKSRILVQKRIFKRHECSLFDYLYIVIAMTITRITPIWLYKIMYRRIKQNDKKKYI